jgi:hypothetical protein
LISSESSPGPDLPCSPLSLPGDGHQPTRFALHVPHRPSEQGESRGSGLRVQRSKLMLPARRLQVLVNPVLANLTTSLLPRLRQKIDLLVFNPPYVPTTLEECVRLWSSRLLCRREDHGGLTRVSGIGTTIWTGTTRPSSHLESDPPGQEAQTAWTSQASS